MDTGSVIVVLLIGVWGGLEYHRREQKHKAALESLGHGGLKHPQASPPAVAKLFGEALVAILLAAGSALMCIAGLKGESSNLLLYSMAAVFLSMTVIVALMFLRDLTHRRRMTGVSTQEEP